MSGADMNFWPRLQFWLPQEIPSWASSRGRNRIDGTVFYQNTIRQGHRTGGEEPGDIQEILEEGILLLDLIDLELQNNVFDPETDRRADAATETTAIDFLRTRTVDVSTRAADFGEEICVICQDDICNAENQHEIVILECRHMYHVECIRTWLVQKNSCPVCKSTVLPINE